MKINNRAFYKCNWWLSADQTAWVGGSFYFVDYSMSVIFFNRLMSFQISLDSCMNWASDREKSRDKFEEIVAFVWFQTKLEQFLLFDWQEKMKGKKEEKVHMFWRCITFICMYISSFFVCIHCKLLHSTNWIDNYKSCWHLFALFSHHDHNKADHSRQHPLM